jgi:hypothetical protein
MNNVRSILIPVCSSCKSPLWKLPLSIQRDIYVTEIELVSCKCGKHTFKNSEETLFGRYGIDWVSHIVYVPIEC